ncbi:beta-ketoacyl synthase N-terminal-like domain-containing protein [Streptomyces lavendulocolor]|uniref:beta-ketoacyl synthase N-terminal-like domain-containing protein n=1 Tax=Streptomyces lavendulocolor TaxID=67316 RepID=UPI0033E4996D
MTTLAPEAGTAAGTARPDTLPATVRPDLPAVRPLVVTGHGVVSAAGYGLAPLGDLLAGGGPGHTGPEGADAADYPPIAVRSVPGFRLADHLGRKGTRNLDRLTGLGLVACKEALLGLADAGAAVSEEESGRTGVVMATNTGSVQSLSDLARDTLVQDAPYMVNPGRFPNTVMNCLAGQMAIRYGLRGLNATVAGGRLSGLFAFRHARIALDQGRAERLLVGGTEELSAPAAWAWHRTGALSERGAVGEGSALFMVEDAERAAARGHTPLAELLACEVGFYGAGAGRHSLASGLAACVERALVRSGVTAAHIGTVALGATHHVGLERIEERAVRAVLGAVPGAVRIADALGETYSAAGAFQVAAVLAGWRRDPAAAGTVPRVALVTSVGQDGNAGALVLRDVPRG